MPKGLARYQKCRVFYFLTFSCYRRLPLLGSTAACRIFEDKQEAVRRRELARVSGEVGAGPPKFFLRQSNHHRGWPIHDASFAAWVG